MKRTICDILPKIGAFRSLEASECFDIIGEVTSGSSEEITQVGTKVLFTAFKRLNFKIWKSRIRAILDEKKKFWALNRAKKLQGRKQWTLSFSNLSSELFYDL